MMKSDLVHTWQDFVRRVREAREELNNPMPVWYRGQSKSSHFLIPSLLRHTDGLSKEQVLFSDYEQSAAHLHGEKTNEWDLLNDMQHYGIPTRLLDWTDVLGIAVAFALFDSNDDHIDSAVYVLNPLALNDLSGVTEIKRARNDADFGYKAVYWQGRPFAPNFPIAVDGTFHNDRIRAQRGVFTVHGRDAKALDQQVPTVVRKVVLPAAVKSEAREFLEHANLNAFSIYPDIVGMARHITRKYLAV
jgi:hypothetical protein